MPASHYTALLLGERRRRIVGLILIYLGGLVLLAAGVTKFAHFPPVVAQLTAAGFGARRYSWLRAWKRCRLPFFCCQKLDLSGSFLLPRSWVQLLLLTYKQASTPARLHRPFCSPFAGLAPGCVIR
jgi:hypothetical protein